MVQEPKITVPVKPVVRWTIGTRNKSAIDCMTHAIDKFKEIFSNRFKTVVCTNHPHLEIQPGLVDEIVYQRQCQSKIILPPPLFGQSGGPAWKLYPGRLSPDTHEIFIDNDLIIYRKPEIFEEFLSSENFLITAAIKRSYSSEIESFVRSDFNINSGIIGLPPHFDFVKEINESIEVLQINEWRRHFDEQTVVAYMLQNKDVLTIPLDVISIWRKGKMPRGSCGIHLAGLNYEDDLLWKNYNTIRMI